MRLAHCVCVCVCVCVFARVYVFVFVCVHIHVQTWVCARISHLKFLIFYIFNKLCMKTKLVEGTTVPYLFISCSDQ